MRRTKYVGLFIVPALVLAGVAACGDDDDNGGGGKLDGGTDSNASETSTTDGSAQPDGSVTDAGDAGGFRPIGTPTTLAAFNPATVHAPEAVATIPNAGGFGRPLVAFTPRGIVAAVNEADAGYDVYKQFTPWSPMHRSLGVTVDSTGNTYVGIGYGGGPDAGVFPPTVPGIYKIPAGGGDPEKFSQGDGNTGWPAGLDIVGTDIYVADANGKILKVDSTGNVTTFFENAILVGNKTACAANPNPLPTPRPFGASWVTHDSANNLYVSNFDYGALIKIPIVGGAAGTPVIVVQGLLNNGTDCQYQSMKGVAVDNDGTIFFATPLSNTLWRTSADGKTVKKELTGKPPFDQVSGLFIDTNPTNQQRRLLVTNFAINAINADAGPTPSLLAIPLQ